MLRLLLKHAVFPGSLVITDVNTGKVKAMVSYPSYDNNKMANQVDSDYFYNYLTQASSSPLLNRPVQAAVPAGKLMLVYQITVYHFRVLRVVFQKFQAIFH